MLYNKSMNIKIPQTKSHVIPIRLSPDLFQKTKKLAIKYKTRQSTFLRLLVEKSIEDMK